MRNEQDFALLSAYLDGVLSTEERTTLEARLSRDPELAEELAELRYVVALVREMPRLKAPRSYALDPAKYGRNATPERRIIYPWRTLGVVAAAGVILIIGLLFFADFGQNQSERAASEPSDAISQKTEVSSTAVQEVASNPTAGREQNETVESDDSASEVEVERPAETATEVVIPAGETTQGAAVSMQQASPTQLAGLTALPTSNPYVDGAVDEDLGYMESDMPPEHEQQGQTVPVPQAGGADGETQPGFGGGGGDTPDGFYELFEPTQAPTERDEQEAPMSMAAPAAAPSDTEGDMADTAMSEAAEEAVEPATGTLERSAFEFQDIIDAFTELFRRLNAVLDWNG